MVANTKLDTTTAAGQQYANNKSRDVGNIGIRLSVHYTAFNQSMPITLR